MSKIIKIVMFSYMLFCGVYTAHAQKPFSQAGKIWLADNYLYVSLVEQGILVIDNQDPRNPKRLGFIEVAGNVDLAVRGNTLYANNHADLVAIDISDLKNVRETKRIPNIFSQRKNNNGGWNTNTIAWRTGNDMNQFLSSLFSNPLNSWNGNNNRNRNAANNTNSGGVWGGLGSFGTTGINPSLAMSAAPANRSAGASQPKSGASKGGSMACFTMVDNYLYTIDARDLQLFDISQPANPTAVGTKMAINTDIETVFAYNDRLFIGSQSGMYIYNIQNRQNPIREGHYRHTRSCDPVVVEGNYAYVTLRDGTDCGGGVNQLDVIDISNPANPRKLHTYKMTNPHGLGIDNGMLFVCDGRDGLKVFDAQDVSAINRNQIAHFSNINTFDVIPDAAKKVLIMMGSNKIFQYDYKNPKNVTLLSEFMINQEN